jgi:hypothetical protein
MNVSDTTFTSKHILLFDLRTIRALLRQSERNFTTASNTQLMTSLLLLIPRTEIAGQRIWTR